MFYDRFYELCQKCKVTPTQVSRDLGIRQSTISMWKKQGTTPKYETLKKLSDYFKVSVDYLLDETSMPSKKSNNNLEQLISETDSMINIFRLFSEGLKEVKKTHPEKLEKFENVDKDIEELEKWQNMLLYLINNVEVVEPLLKLNQRGKSKAKERIEELTEIPRYRLKDAPEITNTPTPPPDAPDEPQEPSEGE